jgi:hypothetical protein
MFMAAYHHQEHLNIACIAANSFLEEEYNVLQVLR